MAKLTDPLGKAFMEFFESQGVRFVDADTKEIITSKNIDEVTKRKEKENEEKKHK